MQPEGVPVSLDQVPEEARDYLLAIQEHQDHPAVQQYFYQVTLCYLAAPDGRWVPFFVIEFRDGLNAALVWNDGQGNWGAGAWQRLTSAEATLQADLSYFQGRPAARSFPEVLEHLIASKPSLGDTSEEATH
jgi:hypothetical protein